ncbi:MAG: hypothetical protein K6F52_06850 [Clostridia bacterium]|nr:hypothetical protein [Clostridia bacterium]
MLHSVDNLVLNELKLVRDNPDYSITVCRDCNASLETHYILLRLKNPSLKRSFMECIETECRSNSEERPWISCFPVQEDIAYVFPYREERSFKNFSHSQLTDTYRWEHAALNLVSACMSNPLPYPLLYLILDEESINLTPDDEIYFTNFFRLEDFDRNVDEHDCVAKCSNLVLNILEQARLGKKKRLKSLFLIKRKVEHESYKSLAELYKDINYCAVSAKKAPFFKRLFPYLAERKDPAFKAIMGLCIILLVISVLMLLSQLIFGDASFLQFGHEIPRIGTESMKN